jgi:hypothetical protein
MSGGDARPQLGGGNGFLNPDDRRQFAREFQELGRDAQQLRQALQAAGINPQDLDQVTRGLAQGENTNAYSDLKGLQQLQASALEQLKKFEFNLRKKLDAEANTMTLSGSDEVPASFRTAIEEYYRQLARNQAKAAAPAR